MLKVREKVCRGSPQVHTSVCLSSRVSLWGSALPQELLWRLCRVVVGSGSLSLLLITVGALIPAYSWERESVKEKPQVFCVTPANAQKEITPLCPRDSWGDTGVSG